MAAAAMADKPCFDARLRQAPQETRRTACRRTWKRISSGRSRSWPAISCRASCWSCHIWPLRTCPWSWTCSCSASRPSATGALPNLHGSQRTLLAPTHAHRTATVCGACRPQLRPPTLNMSVRPSITEDVGVVCRANRKQLSSHDLQTAPAQSGEICTAYRYRLRPPRATRGC